MADPERLVSRIRARGANVMIDGDKLVIVNRAKLSDEALRFIGQHHRAVADFLVKEGRFDERAAIIEFDGKAPREWAEQFAEILISRRPRGIRDEDWSWFLTQCGRIIDEAPEQVSA